MKILVKGDFHNKFSEFKHQLDGRTDVDLVLGVGDSGIYWRGRDVRKVDQKGYDKMTEAGHDIEYMDDLKDWPIPTYVVPGNHEDMEYIDSIDHDFEIIPNFTVMHNAWLRKPYGEYFLYVFFLGKILVDTSLDLDKELINNYGVSDGKKFIQKWLKKRNHLHRSEIKEMALAINRVNRIRKPGDKVIWVSHDAPSHTHQTRGYPVGHHIFNQLLDLAAPDLAFCGHYHYDYKLDDVCRIVPKYELLEINI